MNAGAGTVLAALAGTLAGPGLVLTLGEPREGRFGSSVHRWVVAALRAGTWWVRALVSPDTPLTRARRRRLRVLAGAVALVAGTVLFGVRAAALVAPVAAWLAPRLVEVRRKRHGRRVEEGAAAAALALADSLSAGASARGCVAEAAYRLRGPIAHQLRQTAWELEVGAATDAALERLRERSASRGVGLVVAAVLVQRRSGGDLARVLRGVARALEDERRLRGEVRAATAQARFTAVVVIALPACGVALAALASPDLLARMTATPFGIGCLLGALLLQGSGALLIRRLASPVE